MSTRKRKKRSKSSRKRTSRKRKWISRALAVKRRRRGYSAHGRTPKLNWPRIHEKAVRVEAAHKGDLHEWAHHRLGWSLNRKFDMADIHEMERVARADHDKAHGEHEWEETLHALKMVLFAKNVHGLRHHRGPRRHHATRHRRSAR